MTAERPKRPLILIVDDDPGVRLLFSTTLRQGDFSVVEAEDGRQGLEAFERHRPDLVVLDVLMPRMDGFETCRALRGLPGGEHLPIIIVTSLDDIESIERAYQLGATDFITKPVNWLILNQRVRYVLRAVETMHALRRSEADNRALIHAVPDAILHLSRDGEVLMAKPGRACDASLKKGQNLSNVLSKEQTHRAMTAIEQSLQTDSVQTFEYMLRQNEETRIYEARVVANGPDHATAIVRDITERLRREEDIRKLTKVIEQSPVSILITDAAGNIEYVNPRFLQVAGQAHEMILNKPSYLLRANALPREEYELLHKAVSAGGEWRGELCRRRKDGSVVWESAYISTVRSHSGDITHFIAIKEDITEKKAVEERIRHLAFYDVLTGLPNRVMMQERLKLALGLAKRHQRRVAVLFLDLDHFKRVNDSLGHNVGDGLLKQVALRLEGCVRQPDSSAMPHPDGPHDAVARLGGDEFLILLPEIGCFDDAVKVTERILAALQQPFELFGHEIVVGASIGIAIYPDDGTDIETLQKHADTAMYHAKTQGRNNFQLFSTWMKDAAVQRLTLENHLRRALEREEIFLHYQPLARLSDEARTGPIVAVETLLRWRNPEAGLIAPTNFIPIAEDIGLITPLGEWVLRRACAQLSAWQTPEGFPPLRMSVNLSSRQLRSEGLIQIVAAALNDAGLEPSRLELELTENALMEDPDAAARILGKLRDLGVRIAIDDFGAGHSSLNCLKRFPLSTLKIDRSFVWDYAKTPRNAALMRAIVALARDLDLICVAEGVETEAQMRFLRELGCELAQGYLISPPVEAEEIGRLVRKHA